MNQVPKPDACSQGNILCLEQLSVQHIKSVLICAYFTGSGSMLGFSLVFTLQNKTKCCL